MGAAAQRLQRDDGLLARRPRRSLDLAHESRLGRADPGRRRHLRLARRAAQLYHRDRLERRRGSLRAVTGRRRRNSSARRSRVFTRSSGRRFCGRSAKRRPNWSSRTAGSPSTGKRWARASAMPSIRSSWRERFGADSMRYFPVARGAVRQRLLVFRGENRPAPQQRSRKRSRQSLAANAFDVAALSRRRRAAARRFAKRARGSDLRRCRRSVRERILDLHFREALEGVWELVTALNRTIDERKPWELHKAGRNEELDALLYDLCEGSAVDRDAAASVHARAYERNVAAARHSGTNRRGLVGIVARLGRPRAAHANRARGAALSEARRAAAGIDRHALPRSRFASSTADRDDVVARARAAGVTTMLTVGENIDDSCRAIAVAERYEIPVAVGIHPHEAKNAPAEVAQGLRPLLDEPGVVAIGETGLDYYYLHSPRDEPSGRSSRAASRSRATTALPVVFHQRDAFDDFTAILREEWQDGHAWRRPLLYRHAAGGATRSSTASGSFSESAAC